MPVQVPNLALVDTKRITVHVLVLAHAIANVSAVVGTTVTGVNALVLVPAIASVSAVVVNPTVAGVLAS
jgi:hypothetical protein